MKVSTICCLGLILLIASFATAQVPCGGTIIPNAALFVNWPQFQYDTAHTGCNPYESILKPSNLGNLAVKWQQTGTPGGSDFSGSVVSDGVLYAIFVGGHGDYTPRLEAVNASTGGVLWTFTPDTFVDNLSSPAVGKGLVYVGGTDHNIYALDINTGTLVWQYTTGYYVATPTVVNGIVYVGSDRVYALDASTGALIWKSDPAPFSTTPALANGVVYVGSVHNVNALNASTGELLWSYATGGNVSSAPSVALGKVYVASDQVYALSASTGVLIWKYPFSNPSSAPAVSRGLVYLGSRNGNVAALNGSTGALVWNYFSAGGDFSSAVVANGVVYIGSDTGPAVTALDAGSGALLWSSSQQSQDSSPPTIVNGMVYVGIQDFNEVGHFYAYSLNGQ